MNRFLLLPFSENRALGGAVSFISLPSGNPQSLGNPMRTALSLCLRNSHLTLFFSFENQKEKVTASGGGPRVRPLGAPAAPPLVRWEQAPCDARGTSLALRWGRGSGARGAGDLLPWGPQSLLGHGRAGFETLSFQWLTFSLRFASAAWPLCSLLWLHQAKAPGP